MFKAFVLDLYRRLWLSYRSTLLGLLVAAVAEALAYFGSANGVPPYFHALIGLVTVPFLAWKDKAVADGTIKLLGFSRIGVCVAIAAASIAGCAFFKAAATNVEACTQSDPTTLARIANALIDLAEQQWLAAVQAIEPNADTAKCDMAGIIAAAEAPDAGFVYVLGDGGVVAPGRLNSAAQLGETNQQRLVRRARTYLALTQ